MTSADRITVLPGGVYFEAFSSRLTSTLSISMASKRTNGRSRANLTMIRCCLSMARAPVRADPTTSSKDCHSRFNLTSPLSIRAMSSRLPTRVLMRRASS